MMNNEDPVVVLLGKLGHGKTRLLNLLCDTNYSSAMTANSCTSTLQMGKTDTYSINIIDTPGFESSDDTSIHTTRQIEALESQTLSGIYIVVKYGRLGEMAETAGLIMDFADTDEACIIVTYTDAVSPNCDVMMEDSRARLSVQLDISVECVLMTGLHSAKDDVETFIWTTLRPPKQYRVSADFRAYANTLQVGVRKSMVYLNALCDKSILQDKSKVGANSKALIELAKSFSAEERYLFSSKLLDALSSSQDAPNGVLEFILNETRYPPIANPKRKNSPAVEASVESAIKKIRKPACDINLSENNGLRGPLPPTTAVTAGPEPSCSSTSIEPPKCSQELEGKAIQQQDHRKTLKSDERAQKQQSRDTLSLGSLASKRLQSPNATMAKHLYSDPTGLESSKESQKCPVIEETPQQCLTPTAQMRNRKSCIDDSEIAWCQDLDHMERGEVLRTGFRRLSLSPRTAEALTETSDRKACCKAPVVVVICLVCLFAAGIAGGLFT